MLNLSGHSEVYSQKNQQAVELNNKAMILGNYMRRMWFVVED